MNKIYIVLLLSTALLSLDIPIQSSTVRAFKQSVNLNSKIIQLSNAKQSVTSLMNGYLEKYFVKPGQNVKRGQKVALIKSIVVSKMTANYISFNEQYNSLKENYNSNKKLYQKGILSLQKLNTLSIELNIMKSNIISLKSQLKTLNIDTRKLKKATSNFILYAHSEGQVSQLLLPLHTVVREDEALISIIKNQAFYVESYLPLKYSNVIKIGQKLVIKYNNKHIVTHITQILPELDLKTQRIIVLSSIDEKTDDLFINRFVESTLYYEEEKKYISVNKTAISFFNNEWVVFVPIHDEHKEYNDYDEHKEDNDHDEHKEESVSYEARIIKIITQNEKYVAVKGLEVGEKYVSDKSYYVKSLMLKSSLGEHGH